VAANGAIVANRLAKSQLEGAAKRANSGTMYESTCACEDLSGDDD
jgi:hypothetical protein